MGGLGRSRGGVVPDSNPPSIRSALAPAVSVAMSPMNAARAMIVFDAMIVLLGSVLLFKHMSALGRFCAPVLSRCTHSMYTTAKGCPVKWEVVQVGVPSGASGSPWPC